MTPLIVSQPRSRGFVRDEIRKKVHPVVDLPFDALGIVLVEDANLTHNWDIQFKAAWTGANIDTYHRHAIAVVECASAVRRDYPIVDFDE